ncbi:hypothetical protein SARC_02428 [Sphaeroforma arctica JP610]|uniref:Protein kinase domain-containing protein n=1 Tax=Sphaeroforma arctica JP610 TaxID=667725 RepID=A0A0L0G8N3_9EUKA|nr:hypothetical protein SARC_02428 [Sphaeroforma arctica JP610]KNC85397.1 hypothetical protein SARC_02428 [Sphaeroforma arctica JP610]|eukprot:XP_014159299.1 hypothetical protein SARC_02428 [Sphaeroforma arctica JP610]
MTKRLLQEDYITYQPENTTGVRKSMRIHNKSHPSLENSDATAQINRITDEDVNSEHIPLDCMDVDAQREATSIEISRISLLGRGGFAKVYKVQSTRTEKIYAAKKQLGVSSTAKKTSLHEERLLNECRCANVVQDTQDTYTRTPRIPTQDTQDTYTRTPGNLHKDTQEYLHKDTQEYLHKDTQEYVHKGTQEYLRKDTQDTYTRTPRNTYTRKPRNTYTRTPKNVHKDTQEYLYKDSQGYLHKNTQEYLHKDTQEYLHKDTHNTPITLQTDLEFYGFFDNCVCSPWQHL